MLKRKALFVGRIRKDFHYRNKMKYPPPQALGGEQELTTNFTDIRHDES
jgi:hypothetical protein